MPTEIRRITEQFLSSPVKVEVSKPATAATTITQQLVRSGREPHDKRETLRQLIRGTTENFKNAIVFCNRKREVALLHRSLVKHGFNAVALHGDLEQPARMAALDKFRKGEADLLIASDVAARGLDIPDVSHVLNFDVPFHADDYIHRIGRTGRAGKTGTAYTVVTSADSKAIAAIEKLIGTTIPYAADIVLPERPEGSGEPSRTERPRERQRGERGRGERSRGERSRSEPVRSEAQRGESGRSEAPRGEPNRGETNRGEPNRRQSSRNERPGTSEAPAPVTRLEPQRRRPQPDAEVEADHSHLPAFLLRPVRIKA
jgi:superfamily II DNA/RNA helicase